MSEAGNRIRTLPADAPKTDSRVEVAWVNDYLFLGNDEKGHTIIFDSAEARPGARGFGPMKALLSCLGACSGMDVVAILAKRKHSLSSLRVEVTGKRPQFGTPKPFTEIHLRFFVTGVGLAKQPVEDAVKSSVEKYCSVAATLTDACSIDYSCEITEA